MSVFLRMMHGLQSVKMVEPVPPSPGYNYILLNDFITPMPATRRPYESEGDSRFDDFCNTVPSEWGAEYQESDLVSSTTGAQMLDSDTPVDFSSKGIPEGTPFGIVTWGSCPLESGPSYAITASSVSNGCTIELWYKTDYGLNNDDNVWLVSIGHNEGIQDGYPKLLLSMDLTNSASYSDPPVYSVMLRLTTVTNTSGTDYTETVSTNWTNGQWHHYALTYDASTNYVHFFLDGHKVKSITDATNDIQELFTTVSYMDFVSSDGYNIPKGRTAQIAVCDQCKWTDDFTVPTVAY